MKRQNWAMLAVGVIGLTGFVLSRTVWGPPGQAGAAEPAQPQVQQRDAEPMSDAERRYLSNQPRHWRYVMLKRN
jgi:hypothetical protein